jgi:sugar/nucleoside kinase (ribokinase family)
MTAPFTADGRIGRLLHLGSVVIDVVLNVPALPERGSDVLASAATSTPGGGFNVMAAASRQGLPVAYAGARGTGPFATLAKSALAAEGIDVLLPPTPGADTGIVITIVEGDGERTFVTATGAEDSLTAASLAAVQAGPGDAVYLSGYGLLHPSNRPALLGWLPSLDERSVLFFDPGPLVGRIPRAVLVPVLQRANWLSCNAREAALLTAELLLAHDPGHRERLTLRDHGGRSGHLIAELTESARTLADLAMDGRRDLGIIVHAGQAGCILAQAGADPVHIPGFPVTAIDTTGAGDTHAGVFIAGLAAGAGPPEAARRANAAAAISVTRRGPATAPTAAELTAFLARQS